ncbi:MAG: hypothetical protein ACKOFI_10830, partial [Phycisphaerales bacterium]
MRLLDRLEESVRQIEGHLYEMRRALRRWNDLVGDELQAFDETVAAFDPAPDLSDQLYKQKIAFIALLNFDRPDLKRMLAEGDRWSIDDWAAARVAQRFGRGIRVGVDPPPHAKLDQARPRDLPRGQHGGHGVEVLRALRVGGVLDAQHALGERLVEERERLGARGVRHVLQRGPRRAEGAVELLEVVPELVHGGVEAVPAELVLQAVGAQPRAVAVEQRAHRVARALGDLDRDARPQEVGVLGGEAELAQHLRQRALERGLVGEARAHGGVQLRGGARLGHVLEVDVVRLERAAELGAQERGKPRAHRVVEQLDQQPFHVLLGDLAREVELARDGARRLGVVRVEAAGDLGMRQEVPVALGPDGVRGRDRRAAHGVARGVPRGAARGAFHHGAGDAAVDCARHHPHQGVLLVEAVGVAVSGLDLLAHQPVGKQRAVGLEPALALGVDHGADGHVEARDEVLRLVPDPARVVGEFRGDARPEALRHARGGPVVDRPAVALGEHALQVRPVEVEERDEGDLLLVELVAQVGRGVERGDR